MTLKRLFSPCLLGHSREWVYGPGLQTKLCERCQQPIGRVLAGEMITDPLPQSVAGQPTGRAIRERRQNVTPWKVSGR